MTGFLTLITVAIGIPLIVWLLIDIYDLLPAGVAAVVEASEINPTFSASDLLFLCWYCGAFYVLRDRGIYDTIRDLGEIAIHLGIAFIAVRCLLGVIDYLRGQLARDGESQPASE